MCGIIGYTGTKSAVPVLLEGLERLEYRGYDSAGIALSENGFISVYKSKGRLSCLKSKLAELDKLPTSTCGIGHTRWATHGEPSDINSHPHGTDNVSIVHNGIIENYSFLKDVLIKENGYSFSSETDTEAAALTIDYFYRECGDPYEAMRKAINALEGSYAIAAVFKGHSGKIFAARKDNPLIIAVSDEGNFIASDIPAVLKHTRKYYHLYEGEIAEVTATSVSIYNSENEPVDRALEKADWDMEAAEKGGHPHFMIKEIGEEPDSIVKTLRPRISEGLPCFDNVLSDEKLCSFDKIHIIGCGTAMHAGLVGSFAIENLARVSTNVEIASEFRYKNPILNKNELAIIISQSGETADTLAALKLAKKNGLFTLAIVNVAGSTIAREADCVLYTWAGPEIAVASTKAYTVQISLLYLFAIRLAYAKGKLSEKSAAEYTDELINKAPTALREVFALSDKCRKVADTLKGESDIFYMGRGLDYALSMEGSLKLKEISYIHCESYAAGELKHGTISLITNGVPVIALANSDSLFDKTMSNIKEVRSRGAMVVIVCREKDVSRIPEGLADEIIAVPSLSELFMAIPVSTVTQLIAYHTSALLGCDVDKPRNLAKSVTVE